MKRALLLSIELEYPVVVDDSDPDWKYKAQVLAMEALRDDQSNIEPQDFNVGPLTHSPGPWTDDDLVYHDGKGDITLAEASKLPGGYGAKLEALAQAADKEGADAQR